MSINTGIGVFVTAIAAAISNFDGHSISAVIMCVTAGAADFNAYRTSFDCMISLVGIDIQGCTRSYCDNAFCTRRNVNAGNRHILMTCSINTKTFGSCNSSIRDCYFATFGISQINAISIRCNLRVFNGNVAGLCIRSCNTVTAFTGSIDIRIFNVNNTTDTINTITSRGCNSFIRQGYTTAGAINTACITGYARLGFICTNQAHCTSRILNAACAAFNHRIRCLGHATLCRVGNACAAITGNRGINKVYAVSTGCIRNTGAFITSNSCIGYANITGSSVNTVLSTFNNRSANTNISAGAFNGIAGSR